MDRGSSSATTGGRAAHVAEGMSAFTEGLAQFQLPKFTYQHLQKGLQWRSRIVE